MPNKHNDARRHHIPKMRYKVTNWAAYEAGLRRRGSLTLGVSEDVRSPTGVRLRGRRQADRLDIRKLRSRPRS